MNSKHLHATLLTLFFISGLLYGSDSLGEKTFKAYCWGCHHQTAQAFGPSFRKIANTRVTGDIISQIVNPKLTYKRLGYKRNSMPAFDDLKPNEINAIVKYIESYKDKK
jgi:mono/diheme cytochrome c family protein